MNNFNCISKCNEQNILRELPSSIHIEITAVVLFDNHPRSHKNLSATVCTKNNEVKEFYGSDNISSIKLESLSKLEDIKLLRNSKCEIFYVVKANDELFIISSSEKLKLLHNIRNVDVYDFEDYSCTGISQLKVICKDDAVPIVFGDDFERLVDDMSMSDEVDYEFPVITNLKRNFTEVKYCVQCNEQTLKEVSDLHQLVAFSTSKKLIPSSKDNLFFDNNEEIQDELCLKSHEPWIKLCNNAVVIVLYVYNKSLRPIENLHLLLHNSLSPVMNYTTKVYQKTSHSPFWQESKNYIDFGAELAVVAVVDLKQLQANLVNRIELDAVISFLKMNDECLMPLKKIQIPALKILQDEFNILSNDSKESQKTILAMLATTQNLSLIFKIITKKTITQKELLNEFCTKLNMEILTGTCNILICKKCPYGPLYGSMMIFEDGKVNPSENLFSTTFYTRCYTQVMVLIRSVYELFPYRVVISTDNQIISAKSDKLPFKKTTDLNKNIEYQEYASKILFQCKHILKYFDKCIVKMNSSKDQSIKSKCGTEIDLLADGDENYLAFKNTLNGNFPMKI